MLDIMSGSNATASVVRVVTGGLSRGGDVVEAAPAAKIVNNSDDVVEAKTASTSEDLSVKDCKWFIAKKVTKNVDGKQEKRTVLLDSGATHFFDGDPHPPGLPCRNVTVELAEGELEAPMNCFGEVSVPGAKPLAPYGRIRRLLDLKSHWGRHGLVLKGPGIYVRADVVDDLPYISPKDYQRLKQLCRQRMIHTVLTATMSDYRLKELMEAYREAQQEFQDVDNGVQPLSAKSEVSREEHLRQGHEPFDPSCKECLLGAGRDRQHRRTAPSAGSSHTLSADISGPHPMAKDGAVYMLVGSLKMKEAVERPSAAEEGDKKEEEPAVQASTAKSSCTGETADWWEAADVGVEEEESPKDQQLRADGQASIPFVRFLRTKSGPEVLRALQSMVAEANNAIAVHHEGGGAVGRVHTDGGGEFINKETERWLAAQAILLWRLVIQRPMEERRGWWAY